MKTKRAYLTIAALLVAGGLWLVNRSGQRPNELASDKPITGVRLNSLQSNTGFGPQTSSAGSTNGGQPGRLLRPPDPFRRFTEFTPEQRVEFARKGHGPGG